MEWTINIFTVTGTAQPQLFNIIALTRCYWLLVLHASRLARFLTTQFMVMGNCHLTHIHPLRLVRGLLTTAVISFMQLIKAGQDLCKGLHQIG